MIDERLTTSSAQSLMRAAGKNAKKARPGIDAAAATLILEQALALERAGNAPGKRIEECK
jgi:putative Holliday junction resolvase